MRLLTIAEVKAKYKQRIYLKLLFSNSNVLKKKAKIPPRSNSYFARTYECSKYCSDFCSEFSITKEAVSLAYHKTFQRSNEPITSVI